MAVDNIPKQTLRSVLSAVTLSLVLTADARNLYHFAILMSPCLAVNICDRQPLSSVDIKTNTLIRYRESINVTAGGKGKELTYCCHFKCGVEFARLFVSVAGVTFLETPKVGKPVFC